jgi:hypothetical protein
LIIFAQTLRKGFGILRLAGYITAKQRGHCFSAGAHLLDTVSEAGELSL